MEEVIVQKVEKVKSADKYIWSNFNVGEEANYSDYEVFFGQSHFCDLRASRNGDFCVNIEVGLLSLDSADRILEYVVQYLKKDFPFLMVITTYLVAGDFFGTIMMERAGFMVSVKMRKSVIVRRKRKDLFLLTYEVGKKEQECKGEREGVVCGFESDGG